MIIGLENQFSVFLRVAVLDRFYCIRSVKCSVSETYRDVEQTELNVRGTMSQLANDAISAQIRQNVSTALTSLSRYVCGQKYFNIALVRQDE